MATEQCAICASTVPFSESVHLLIHTNSDEGVIDHYICRACYEDQIASLFEAEE